MKVRFFAHLASFTRCGEIDLAVPEAISSRELWERLEREFPGIAIHAASTRLALNARYAEPHERFGEGDEVALIPPVSGG